MIERSPIDHTFLINDKNMHVVEWPINKNSPYDDNAENSPIVFLHATGFHARCWDQVIRHLPNVPVYAIDTLCHGQSDSIDPPYYWPNFAPYTEALIVKLGIKNITGVGHSFGGNLLTLIAASKPELFKHVLLLDPVIGDPEHMKFWQVVTEKVENPVAKRRNQWASVDELHDQLSKKRPYKFWDKQVFNDYCEHGLLPSSTHDGYELACSPSCEAAIYGVLGSEKVFDKIPNLQTPVTIIRAKERQPNDSPLDFSISPTWNELVTRFPNAKEEFFPDRTHFFPMEDPKFVADTIAQII